MIFSRNTLPQKSALKFSKLGLIILMPELFLIFSNFSTSQKPNVYILLDKILFRKCEILLVKHNVSLGTTKACALQTVFTCRKQKNGF